MLFCDLVDSTSLAQQLDPEDYRAVVRAYQEAAAKCSEESNGKYTITFELLPNDADGLDVAEGIRRAPEARAVEKALDVHADRLRGGILDHVVDEVDGLPTGRKVGHAGQAREHDPGPGG